MKSQPLIATFVIDSSAQEYFNSLRKQHFPPERNYIDAHLTLFHALPNEPWIKADLKELASMQYSFQAKSETIVSLGFGTAFKIVSPELSRIHGKLQQSWYDHLTNQDKQKRNFHITIQNKVEPAVAKELQQILMVNFKPFDLHISGIQLWRYLGGPWEFVTQYDFIQKEPVYQNP
ncbi:2'-5' RNA ligase family protein [Dyadobacter luteus]|uniref:2'-5' RNA ligase family protein n=1 Tax=Dyadobacter luteus TaxID=2259619 RepID=A0A3D8Y662_9BACT|nr:2'-5' RNA ligase family protein [Dyadobacter luteus]REA56112.1 2'-5' RNA ligase family protein [Dyadobacter luteus]